MKKRVLSVIIIAMCLAMLIGCNNTGFDQTPEFDQTTDKDSLLTKTYPVDIIYEYAWDENVSEKIYSKFEKEFDVECVRKTYQGYYVVLLLDNGENAFMFFREDNSYCNAFIAGEFYTKEEFQDSVTEKTPLSEVRDFDPNYYYSSYSSTTAMSIHIVQEGICIVKYKEDENNKNNEMFNPLVTSVGFISNEQIPTTTDSYIRDKIPYILEMDKKSG